MRRYPMNARVRRTVVDHLSLTVFAENDEEAMEKAYNALLLFPRVHTEKGIDYCFVDEREYEDTDVFDIQLMEEGAG